MRQKLSNCWHKYGGLLINNVFIVNINYLRRNISDKKLNDVSMTPCHHYQVNDDMESSKRCSIFLSLIFLPKCFVKHFVIHKLFIDNFICLNFFFAFGPD